MAEITTIVGRLVAGHPMISKPKKDNKNQQKYDKNNDARVSFYCGFAIKKGAETTWKDTEWGRIIVQEATTGFPAGEYNHPAFAWKIDDGDSNVPNKKGKIPCQREGWPGNWVLHLNNGYPFSCYHDGKFDQFQSIQDKNEIKTGDYCQFVIFVQPNNVNGKVETDGVYLNPTLFNLVRAGERIVSANEPDAAEKFGAGGASLPAGAVVDPNVQPTTQQPGTTVNTGQQPGIEPAPDFLDAAPPPPPNDAPAPPVTMYVYNGKQYTYDALIAAKWPPAEITKLPTI